MDGATTGSSSTGWARMGPPRSVPGAGAASRAEFLSAGGPEHEGVEQELRARGIPVPLPHRAVWARHRPAAGWWFLVIRAPSGATVGGLTLEVVRSRALPGHLVLRGERIGDSLQPEAFEPAFRALAELAHHEARILRIDLETFALDPARLDAMGAALTGAGF
jgi:hypothetical protein